MTDETENMRKCIKCKSSSTLEHFNRNKQGEYSKTCMRCCALMKEHYEAHKEQIAENHREYRQSHKETIAERGKERKHTNKEHKTAQQKEYRESHKEHIAEKTNYTEKPTNTEYASNNENTMKEILKT